MTNKIVISADSTVDLSPEIAEKYSVVVSPMLVTMGGKTYATPLNLAGDCTQAIGIGTCIGTPTPDGKAGLEMPKGHGGAHAPDEKIWIPGFFEAMRLLVQYVLATDEYLNK